MNRYRTAYSKHVRLYRLPLKQIQLRTGPQGGKRSLTYFRRIYLENILKKIFKKVRIDPTDAKSEVFYQYYYLLRTDISEEHANEAKNHKHPLDHRLGIATNVPDGFLKYPERYIVLNLEHVVLAIMKYFSTIETQEDLDVFLLSVNTYHRPFDWVLYQYANILFNSVSVYNDIEGAAPIDVSIVRNGVGTIPMWMWDEDNNKAVFFRVRHKITKRLCMLKEFLDDISRQLVDSFYLGNGFAADVCFDSNQFIRDDNSYLPISIKLLKSDVSCSRREGGPGPMSYRSPSQIGSRRLEDSNLTDDFMRNRQNQHPVVISVWNDSFGDAAYKRQALLEVFNLNADLRSNMTIANEGSQHFNDVDDNDDASLCDMNSDGDRALCELNLESSKDVPPTSSGGCVVATVTPAATSVTLKTKATALGQFVPPLVTASCNSTAPLSREDPNEDHVQRLTSAKPFSSSKNGRDADLNFGKRIVTSVHQCDVDEARRDFQLCERKVQLSEKDLDTVNRVFSDETVTTLDAYYISNVLRLDEFRTLKNGAWVSSAVSAKNKRILFVVLAY